MGLAPIKSFVFLSTGVKCTSIDWLDLIDNSWARIDVLRDKAYYKKNSLSSY